MSLPTLIAGPILRRVEPGSVSVWAAFSKAQFVQLVLWDNEVEGSSSSIINTDGFYAKSEASPTVEFASKLHVIVITIDISQKQLKEDTPYCYNLYFGDKDAELSNDLATSGFLNPAVPDANQLIKPVALGYNVGRLPTLVVPGITLETFHLLHGSCRKIHGEGDEAFRHADTLLGKTFDDLTKRPQQLVLTGDQIYADEIPQIVLPFINSLGKDLFGQREQLAFINSGESIDNIPADMTHFPANCRQQLINQWAKLTGNGIASHLTSFQEYCSTYLYYWSPDAWSKELVLMLSRYRESKYDEQVGSFQYYYLVNSLKDLDVDLKDLDGGATKTIKTIFEVLFKFADESQATKKITEVTQLLTTLKTATPPAPTDAQKAVIEKWKDNFNKDLTNPFPAFDSIVKTMCIAESLDESSKNQLASFYSLSSVLKESRSSCDFLECVPIVRRVLANIPTYMIFDDHEITDDWNFSQFWKNRAHTSPIGTQLLRNGLMAYTIFQDWGNVPAEYPAILFNPPADPDDDLKKKQEEYLHAVGKVKGNKIGLLKKISDYGKAIAGAKFPEAPAELSNLLDTMLLLGEKKEDNDNDKEEQDKPPEFATPIKWHYSFLSGPAQTFMLDTRTRREYDQLTGLPGLLSQEALDEQLPEHIAELNLPVVFVVSPVPALSTHVMEEFAQPLASMIQGGTTGEGVGGAPIGAVSGALKRDMEAWGFSERHLERLLERLAKFKKVVILSGDIHFGFSSFADYWKERKAENHARIVQLVSSPFKNGWDLEFVLLKSGFAQRLLGSFDFKFEKHGWKDKTLKINDSELDLKLGARIAPRHRMRLRRNPIVLPRHGWNIETIIDPVEPDWAWVMEVCVDQTIFENFDEPELSDFHFEIDKDLPEEIIEEEGEETPESEGGNEPVNSEEIKKTLLQMAARHNAHFKLGRNRRLIWQPHVGHVFFTISDDGLKRTILNHEFHYTCRSDGLLNNDRAPDMVPKVTISGPFTLHSVDLDVTEDKKVPPLNLNTAPPPPEED